MPSSIMKILIQALILHSFFMSNSLYTLAKTKDQKDFISIWQNRILYISNRLMEELPISYSYGGSQVTSIDSCMLCTKCLIQESPSAKQRLAICPVCKNCSLDCSHFTQLVYKLAGLKAPYIDTRSMIKMSSNLLLKRYHLALVPKLSLAQTGDLLVYRGHVVILERIYSSSRGDIIHATGGKDIKTPGQGIQRERNIDLQSFRGPLIRILRHKSLLSTDYDAKF